MESIISFIVLGLIIYMFVSIYRIEGTLHQVRDLAKQEAEYKIHSYAVLYAMMHGKSSNPHWPPSPKKLQTLIKLSTAVGPQNRDQYERLKAEYQEAYTNKPETR